MTDPGESVDYLLGLVVASVMWGMSVASLVYASQMAGFFKLLLESDRFLIGLGRKNAIRSANPGNVRFVGSVGTLVMSLMMWYLVNSVVQLTHAALWMPLGLSLGCVIAVFGVVVTTIGYVRIPSKHVLRVVGVGLFFGGLATSVILGVQIIQGERSSGEKFGIAGTEAATWRFRRWALLGHRAASRRSRR